MPNIDVVTLDAGALAARGIERRVVGALPLPTGRIVAADIASNPDRWPLARRVPAGTYEARAYLADDAVALLELRLAEGEVARWAEAGVEGGAAYAHPSDAGLSAFLDVEARDAMMAIDRDLMERGSDFYHERLDPVLWGDGFYAVLFDVTGDGALKAVVSASGYGDGIYGVWWGLDEEGRALTLVTDYGVLEDGRVVR